MATPNIPAPDGPEVLAPEVVVDTLKEYLERSPGAGEAATAVVNTAFEELRMALSQAPLFSDVSPEGLQILAEKTRRIQVPAFATLVDSEDPENSLLKANGLLIAMEPLIVDLPWLQNLAAGQHLGEGGWMGDKRMVTVNSQDEGAALMIEEALSKLGLSKTDQLQIGLNALCNSALTGDNARLATSHPEEQIHMEGDQSFADMAREMAERLGLMLYSAEEGEQIKPLLDYVFLGTSGTVNVCPNGSSEALSQIQFPNLCFEVTGAGGKATAAINACTKVEGYWLPLAAEAELDIDARLVLLEQVRHSHNLKLGRANEQVRASMHTRPAEPEQGLLANLGRWLKSLKA